MRIFLVLYPSGNISVPNSKTWLINFYYPLLDLGHDIFLLNLQSLEEQFRCKINTIRFKTKFSEYLTNSIIKQNRIQKFDLFLSYLTDQLVFPEVIKKINELGILTANFSCNNTHQFYLTKEIAPLFYTNLHSEKNAEILFRNINAPSIWFPLAANPSFYYPITDNRIFDLTFVGANYAQRDQYIEHLFENNIQVHCFGPNWLINKPYPKLRNLLYEYRRYLNIIQTMLTLSPIKRNNYTSKIAYYDRNNLIRSKYHKYFHYPVTDNKMVELYSQSKISLGFLEVYDDNNSALSTMQHLHLREFEGPMCGALYFTNFCDELTEFYEPDKEIIMYGSKIELVDKVRFYLKHPSISDKIRKAAFDRSIKCHTYQIRFKNLFLKLGLE